jgi:hypothetical protein
MKMFLTLSVTPPPDAGPALPATRTADRSMGPYFLGRDIYALFYKNRIKIVGGIYDEYSDE